MTEAPPPQGFAGWPLRSVGFALAIALLGCWIGWASHALLQLQSRRIVSVRLSSLMQDFIATEARSSLPPQASAARTRAYLAAINGAVATISADGTVVLVSEASLGGSVPDQTDTVRRLIAARLDGRREDR